MWQYPIIRRLGRDGKAILRYFTKTNFQEVQESRHSSGRQKGDAKQIPYWRPKALCATVQNLVATTFLLPVFMHFCFQVSLLWLWALESCGWRCGSVTGCCLSIVETPGFVKGRILLPAERSPASQKVLPSVTGSRTVYRYAPHNDVSVNDGPHIRQWSHEVMIM
jgi:hypothetical protein